MAIILVDSCVVLDLAKPDSEWFEWSASMMEHLDEQHSFVVNPIIYTECSIGYETIEEVESYFQELKLPIEPLPREALFMAGKVFVDYRRNQGTKSNVLPDFFIGAHAAINKYSLITRDIQRFTSYFPSVELITPHSHKA